MAAGVAANGATGRTGAEAAGPVVVTAMDRDRMGAYQQMASELRAAGLRAEVFLGGGNWSWCRFRLWSRLRCGLGDGLGFRLGFDLLLFVFLLLLF